MPSTLVHAALAGLVGTALLTDHFDWRAILLVMFATAAIDLDVFVGMVFPGTHRAAFHTLLLPLLGALLLAYDLRYREESLLHKRWDNRGVRVAWVSVVAVTFAGIGPDLFFNGANILYPLHDQFYDFSGKVVYSTERGFVQTLVELDFDFRLDFWADRAAESSPNATGKANASSEQTPPPPSTKNTHYSTGVDPSRNTEKQSVERVFHIFASGERFLLALTGYLVVTLRLWMERE
ncbi:metal-dependent hydrolase [Halorussus halophilus]|uniref:metal-dependent hydrolase n=1 Tax=Halorussus halophilus TaxID=2650975 RepID=UPI001300DDDC|nr:metal-dependent hydrolase [Halorussus halophilus]